MGSPGVMINRIPYNARNRSDEQKDKRKAVTKKCIYLSGKLKFDPLQLYKIEEKIVKVRQKKIEDKIHADVSKSTGEEVNSLNIAILIAY